jgi:hypothetical protein
VVYLSQETQKGPTDNQPPKGYLNYAVELVFIGAPGGALTFFPEAIVTTQKCAECEQAPSLLPQKNHRGTTDFWNRTEDFADGQFLKHLCDRPSQMSI